MALIESSQAGTSPDTNAVLRGADVLVEAGTIAVKTDRLVQAALFRLFGQSYFRVGAAGQSLRVRRDVEHAEVSRGYSRETIEVRWIPGGRYVHYFRTAPSFSAPPEISNVNIMETPDGHYIDRLPEPGQGIVIGDEQLVAAMEGVTHSLEQDPDIAIELKASTTRPE